MASTFNENDHVAGEVAGQCASSIGMLFGLDYTEYRKLFNFLWVELRNWKYDKHKIKEMLGCYNERNR